jgi:hypothetical protein
MKAYDYDLLLPQGPPASSELAKLMHTLRSRRNLLKRR